MGGDMDMEVHWFHTVQKHMVDWRLWLGPRCDCELTSNLSKVSSPYCMSAGGRQGTKSRRTLLWILSTKTLFSSILDLQVSIGFINEQLIGPRRHHGLMYVVYGAWTECWLSYSTLNYRPEWIELNYETISTSTLSICSLWESWWRIFFNISLASFFLRV